MALPSMTTAGAMLPLTMVAAHRLQILPAWQISRERSLRAGHTRSFAGRFLNDTGPGEDVDYFSITLAYRF